MISSLSTEEIGLVTVLRQSDHYEVQSRLRGLDSDSQGAAGGSEKVGKETLSRTFLLFMYS